MLMVLNVHVLLDVHAMYVVHAVHVEHVVRAVHVVLVVSQMLNDDCSRPVCMPSLPALKSEPKSPLLMRCCHRNLQVGLTINIVKV